MNTVFYSEFIKYEKKQIFRVEAETSYKNNYFRIHNCYILLDSYIDAN